ncbi:lysophospholipase [Clostridium sardiniense]|uniref:Lysophospholipase n=1 Tax=Clostridium sardiniense TaxID=29369 RepID=A0ABS7L0I4_CLOSR|nr:alpha/beta hydrolase [Clostridium sardiniense]MBY0756575.1 lysophospholipase [Clostridium sardiniense]MDQ0460324.1 alpha-beta hydrolase superfamily lysophospholipase [Clostridium sardiniense]
MSINNFKFKDSLGKEIHVYKWVPDEKIEIKGVVQIAHGMAETAERYDYFARRLNKEGYAVYANDHRGHGKSVSSKEELGYIGDDSSFKLMIANMKELNDIIKKEYRELPIILFGHSMGSFLSQRYAQIYGETIKMLILSGSNGKPNPITKVGRKIAKIEMNLKGRKAKSPLMDKLSFGDFNKAFEPARTPYDWICGNEETVDEYINDEYCGFICTTSFYHDLIDGIWSIHEGDNFNNIRKDIPIYIFAGDKDPVGYFGKGIVNLYNLYKNIGVKDIQYKLYKDGRHEMLNEKNRDEVINDIIIWIKGRENKLFNIV